MFNLKKILGPNIREKLMYGLSFLPDKIYLQLFYFATTGNFINFRNPKGYNEKLQWLKVNNKNPEYSKLVDKLAVRDHIKEVLGEEYLFPLLGFWEDFDNIDFAALPEQFVLKCNHDSGSTKVIKNKSALTDDDMAGLKAHFTRRLKHDFSRAGREYPYHGIKPYIIAEQMMIDNNKPETSIEDYKFFCFDGVPKVVLIVTDRSTDCRFDYFDMDFNHLDIIDHCPHSDKPINKPENFEEMKKIAADLSKGMKTVRMDLYEINNKIYFGEYTFFSGGGFDLYIQPEWERQMGDWIDLSDNNN